jgi:hypothetical protein
MLAHRVFDHRLVGGDDERGAGGEDEQADGFERLDGRIRQAAVEVVDQHDQLLDARLLSSLSNALRKASISSGTFLVSPGFSIDCTPSMALSRFSFVASFRGVGEQPFSVPTTAPI